MHESPERICSSLLIFVKRDARNQLKVTLQIWDFCNKRLPSNHNSNNAKCDTVHRPVAHKTVILLQHRSRKQYGPDASRSFSVHTYRLVLLFSLAVAVFTCAAKFICVLHCGSSPGVPFLQLRFLKCCHWSHLSLINNIRFIYAWSDEFFTKPGLDEFNWRTHFLWSIHWCRLGALKL